MLADPIILTADSPSCCCSDAAAAAAATKAAALVPVDLPVVERRRRHASARSVTPRPRRRRRPDLIPSPSRRRGLVGLILLRPFAYRSQGTGQDRDGSAELGFVLSISPPPPSPPLLSREGGGDEEDVVVELPVRGLQAAPPQVHAGVRLRALLPAGPASPLRQRAQGLRRQQRLQAPQRPPRAAAGGRRQLARLRGRGAPPRPGLRLRRIHLRPPGQDQAGARGDRQRAQGARRLHRPGRLRAPRPRQRHAAAPRHGPRPRPPLRRRHGPPPAPAAADGHTAAGAAPVPPAAAPPAADRRGAAHGRRRRGGGPGPAPAGHDDDAPGIRPARGRRRPHSRDRASRRSGIGRPRRIRRPTGAVPHPAAAIHAFGPHHVPRRAVIPAAAVLGPLPRRHVPGASAAAQRRQRRGERGLPTAAGLMMAFL